jgi:hypothetical protein
MMTVLKSNAAPVTLPELVIHGKVMDRSTNQPLAYASIGIADKPFGTLCDSLGNFSFTIGEEDLSDTIRISMIGYQTIEISVRDYNIETGLMVWLVPKATELSEVVVVPLHDSTQILGRRNTSKLLQVSIHKKHSIQETIGSEMGMRYKTGRTHAYLKDVNFYFSANSFNSIKLRINIYTVKNNMPDTLIGDRQIFVTLDEFKTGWTSVDLQAQNIRVPNDFIITMQWVESRMEKTGKFITLVPIAFTTSKNCYARVASQDKWQRLGVSLSNFITIAY